MDLPYVLSLGGGSMLAINLSAAWLKPDRSGKPLLLPPAVRALDRLRAVFAAEQKLTPGFISSLREAMGLTQSEFGRKIGVSKMTVSRWECGRIRPSASATTAILKLQAETRREGVRIDGEKLRSRH
jgi:DNA-binding transcriptional regulator YiaG